MVSSKLTEELDEYGHNVVVRNRKEGGLGVHRKHSVRVCDYVVSLE